MSRQQRRAQERAARKRANVARGALAVGAMLAAGTASAATITVNSNLDTAVAGDAKCTLREAINNANANADTTGNDCTAGLGADIVNFSLANPSTITLGGTELPIIDDSLTINGPGTSALTISGNNASRVFEIASLATSPINVNINNLTVTAGAAVDGGAIRNSDENLTLDHVAVTGSVASGDGGGLYFSGYYGAALTVTNSTISGNQAYNGGGLYVGSTSATVSISGTTISGNTATYSGGGIFADYIYGMLRIVNTTISANVATNGYGGGMDAYAYAYASLYLKGDTITGNSNGSYFGGGINVEIAPDGSFTMLTSVVTSNSSGTLPGVPGNGGGVRLEGGGQSGPPQAMIVDSFISGNVADPNDALAAPGVGTNAYDKGYGGGLYLSYINASVQRTTISGNTAYAGGGVYAFLGATVGFEAATIADNFAKSPVSPGYGGGVRIAPYGTSAFFEQTTIAGNSAQSGGGGIDADVFTTNTLFNSIVANNSAPDIAANGPVTATYTLIENPGSTVILVGTGNITGSDPNLGSLAVNSSTIVAGAPGSAQTPLTEMPLCPSPAINAGDPAFVPPPGLDGRGKARVAGGRIDMGAVEVQPSTLQFTTNAQSVNEGAGSVTVTASRTLSADGPVAVAFSTANGSATAPADYAAASGTLSWADGDTANKSFNVAIVDDALFEGNETFSAALSSPTCQAVLGANATQTITIVDNDTAPTLSINSVAQPEGNSGTTAFTFTVTLSAPSGVTTTVNYATANGTATAPGDYAATSGMLTFNPGVTSQPITVNVVGDTACEADEPFTVNLSSPTNATIANGSGTGTIQNDDPCATDVAIVKTASAGPYFVGQQVTYTLAVNNAGPLNAASVTVTDTIPANSTFVSATPSQGSCSGTTTVTCSLGAINNGGSATIALRVTPTATGPLSNTASVSAGTQTDTNPANNNSTAAVTVAPASAIPTLSEWAEIFLAMMLALLALFKIKK